MGTCQCQDRGQNFQFNDKKQQIILTTKVQSQKTQSKLDSVLPLQKNQLSVQPSHKQNPPLLSHAPDSTYATSIGKFPELPKSIIATDKNLREFKTTSQKIWTQQYRPIYIDQAFQLQNGIIYQGQWHKGVINGNGIYYLPDGSFLRGFSMNNQVVGFARLIKQNGNYYQGSVAHNKANGQGQLYENGVLYRGNFVDNFLEGNGSQVSNDYRFEGKYHHGARISGKLTWDLNRNPPTVYEGGFFDEQFNGQGRLTNHIGQYKGMFQNGKKRGKGVFTWKNGQRFQGYYDSDLKNGQGKMYNAKGEIVLQGVWVNDRFKN